MRVKIPNPMRILLLAAVLFTLAACKKEKIDFSYDNRDVTQAQQPSSVRFINLAGFNQLIANGDSLTNFVVRDPDAPGFFEYPGTTNFPKDGRLGRLWTVPLDVFDAQEKAVFDVSTRNHQGLFDQDFNFTATNSYDNPTDYYLLPSFFVQGIPRVYAAKRDVSSPSKPDHIKVRIINLTGKITNRGSNVNGSLEVLEGAVTLVYADGTPVDQKTTRISASSPVSEYVELPYGSYQFRVLTDDGRQFPAVAASTDTYDYQYIDPPTSTMATGLVETTDHVFAPVQAYLPGGIYTIVVAPREFRFFTTELNESVMTMQNAFDIISDNSAPANRTYFRVQGVNALDARPVSFRLNGKSLPGSLGFGQAGEYTSFVQGSYKVEAVDASGSIIAAVEQELRAAQNYTAWLYPDPSGEKRVLLVANDLSGVTYHGSPTDDASNNRLQSRFPFNKRFLNLSPDNAYITFTGRNGQLSSPGSEEAPDVNLQPGIPLMQSPYLRGYYTMPAFEVLAYRSAPDVIPGIWAKDIPMLNNNNFIARRALYENVARQLPVQEPGFYTVALIGQSATAAPAALKAKMMVLKHNK